ncbi:MAG: hypothetical protein HY016_11605 [Nitrosomonadales bacterium]|nr:hypothetical protein [Nitrosomonadales bacterium]
MSSDHALTELIESSLDQVREMKIALLRLQAAPTDMAIASVIPCAIPAIHQLDELHGCQHIVEFSSAFEGVLGRVRGAELCAEAELIAVLLSSCDLISDMVSQLDSSDRELIS